MSTIPAFVNAIFTLNKKGEFLLYEGEIEGGYTRVSVISKLASGYNTRYFKVKQIIALEGKQAIVQSFDLPSAEFAYRLIERAVNENVFSQGEDNGKIEVVTTGQQVVQQSSIVDSERVGENKVYKEYNNNSIDTYQPVVAAQSRKLAEGYSKGKVSAYPDYNDSEFDSLQSFTGTGADEFGGDIKIANMSSFGNGSSPSGNGAKGSYSSLEEALDSRF